MTLIWTLLQSDIAQMILAAIGALGLAWGYGKAKERKGKLAERQRAELDRANANVKAERERVVLDAELDQETDLLARARDSGVVRKDKP